MSSFQFPANPSDGDIVVRGNLQAFYNAATNTWRVSEVPTAPGIPGPPGPPGPIGPPGQGAEVAGVVDSFADLPLPNAHQFEFWITDDTNTLYFSDGIEWKDIGSPIQGPQGEDGQDGADGVNGQNGRGWYDTNVIDQRPTNYQVEFLSNDGLGFVTDNIMGPKGDPGDMEVASEDNCGCIKIGRGLSIEPDGTVNAGETFVDLETVPLTPEGTVYSYTLGYSPQVYGLGAEKEESWLGARMDDGWSTDSIDVPMPSTANRALVYMFSSTQFWGNQSFPGTTNAFYAFRAYIVSELFLENAEYQYGRSNAMAFQTTHNMTIDFNSNSIANRYSVLPVTKINEISFEEGSTVKFNWLQTIYRSGNCRLRGGLCRLIVIPFREEDDGNVTYDTPVSFQKIGDTYYYNKQTGQAEFNEEFPPITPEELNAEASTAIKSQINEAMGIIDMNLPYVNEATQTTLIGIRDQLFAARDQPGTYEDVVAYAAPLIAQVNTLLDYQFRFE